MRFIGIAALLLVTVSALGQTGNLTPPSPNWGVPVTLDDYPLPPDLGNHQLTAPIMNSACPDTTPAGFLNFQFDIPIGGAISTSAVVVDTTTNNLAATLWNSVTLPYGTYCGKWNEDLDMNDSSGNEQLADASHKYQVKVLYDNVQYIWDGMVGVTEHSFAGPQNWDSAGSFPTGMAFQRATPAIGTSTDFGFVANGYNENRFSASVFTNYVLANGQGDSYTVWPLNLALASGGEFDYVAGDGNRIYFAALASKGSPNSNAVVAFTPMTSAETLSTSITPSVTVDNSSGSDVFTAARMTTYGPPVWGAPYLFGSNAVNKIPGWGSQVSYFRNQPANINLNPSPGYDYGVAVGPATGVSSPTTGTDGKPWYKSGDAITGLAVQQGTGSTNNLLAVAQGIMHPQDCYQSSAPYSITFWDKDNGSSGSGSVQTPLAIVPLGLNPLTTASINPQKMAFDNAGNLWVIDGGTPSVSGCSDYPDKPLLGSHGSGFGMDPLWQSYGSLLKFPVSGGHDLSNPPTLGMPTVVSMLANPNAVPWMGSGTGTTSVQLSNPVDVTVSIATGHIFVADGGTNQQVYEFDGTSSNMYSATGAKGGYGFGWASPGVANTCNATIHDNVFWLDFWGTGTGGTRPWIAVDNEDRLWVGDTTTSRIISFQKTNSSGSAPFTYASVGGATMNRYIYQLSVPRNSPTRVFSGQNGLLEYTVGYASPDPAAGPNPPVSNTVFSSTRARNWLPCYMQAEWQAGGYPDPHVLMSSAETFQGSTYGFVTYHSSNPNLAGQNAILNLSTTGSLSIKNNAITLTNNVVYFDPSGNYYHPVSGSGTCQTMTAPSGATMLCQYPATGTSGGFPTWNTGGTILATVAPNAALGEPTVQPSFVEGDGYDFSPTSSNFVALYAGPLANANAALAYHLGGVKTTGSNSVSALLWHTQQEYSNAEYPTLSIDSPHTNPSKFGFNNQNNLGMYSSWIPYGSSGLLNMGFGVHTIDNYIFTGVNGNWGEFSCQFYQYADDGMMVGQFGFRGSGEYSTSSYHQGFPAALNYEALAPGECGNPSQFKMVKVGTDYYLYVDDEGYRAGIQRWHISNLGSVTRLSGTICSTLASQSTALPVQ